MVIGNGDDAKIWQDQWLDQKPARKAQVMRRSGELVLDYVSQT